MSEYTKDDYGVYVNKGFSGITVKEASDGAAELARLLDVTTGSYNTDTEQYKEVIEESINKTLRDFVTKDSGVREEFVTGARRDTQAGKPRYDLISVHALKRIAGLLGRGAEKYGDRNWEMGMPVSRFVSSGLRHFYQFLEGDEEEDHLAAVCFNVMAIMHMSKEIDEGRLPVELWDIDPSD